MLWKHWSGKLAVVVILTLAGCGTLAGLSVYRVTLPVLAAPPVERACLVNDAPRICVVVVKEDFEALVVELKAACRALGGSEEECQTGRP